MKEQPSTSPRPSFTVIAHTMLIRKGSVFLLRRYKTGLLDGWYSLPGGHMELGETITECATRECYEEVGIELESIELRRIHNLSLIHI